MHGTTENKRGLRAAFRSLLGALLAKQASGTIRMVAQALRARTKSGGVCLQREESCLSNLASN